MRWLWPSSLSGRVALILATALIAVQLFTLPYYLQQQANVPAIDSGLLSLEMRSKAPNDVRADGHGSLAAKLSDDLQRQVAIAHEGDLTSVWVALEDDSWLKISMNTTSPSAGWVAHMTAQLLFVGLVLVVVSIIAARQITRPIRTFVSAAKRLGTDVHAPPIPEEGSRELREATAVFNTMQQRLQSYIVDRTRMLAAISHDLRTSLTRLRLRIEYIEDEEQRAKARQDLEQMDTMLASTLSFARDDAAQEHPVKIDLAKLVHTLVDDFTDMGKSVAYEGPETLVFIGKPVALERAVANGISNAVLYGNEAQVSLLATASGCLVCVADNGPGIPPEYFESVFEPFVRLDPARTAATGTGLGLSVIRSVARAHGGDVELENLPAGGLNLKMILISAES